MSNPATREEWVSACAARYLEVSGIDTESADYFAKVCAEQEQDANGPYGPEWESPADAADEDMSYWDNDE